MNQKSKYFDSIRVKPAQDRLKTKTEPECEVSGCPHPGTHKAPKGRGHDGEYHQFCMRHVRDYNKSFNYFKDMPDDAVADYQKSARTGHRPTWSLGANAAAAANADGSDADPKVKDAHGFFGDKYSGDGEWKKKPERRQIRNAERKALATLGLDVEAKPADVKSQYKTLVKRHHPDANGGGVEFEEKLRDIIQAYDYLKKSGFC